MIGQTISHYKILEKLGEGGMGVVYKAEDTKLKRIVALKFLPPELTRDKEAKERFIHEARAAAGLDHNNICAVHEIDETDDGQMYIAMACYEGETLKERIEKGPLKRDEAINIAIQVAQGLERAHESNIIHRDIKSANIFITKRNEVKIIDFGLAKLKGQTKLTKEGTTLGTVAYMSPEQTSGEDADNRSDIWSLGVILYEMITGQLPFKGEYEQAIMYAIMNEDVSPITGKRTGLPIDLERIVDKTLNKNPDERYQHADELIVDLKNLQNQPISREIKQSRDALLRNKSRPRKGWILLTVGSLIALVVAGYFILKKPQRSGESPIQESSEQSSMTHDQWKNSIAVLPFSNISADKEQEYFCDGMTEEIITKLTYINDLKVISRTSVMRLKNSKKTIREIGRELDVENVLEGSVRRDKNRVRITAQLIRVADDAHLWANNYDRKLKDIFTIQDEVSKAIADVLKTTFSPEALDSFKLEQTKNLQAYEYYLKGTFSMNSRYLSTLAEDDFQQAVKMLEKALELDPAYVKGYTGLAWAYLSHWMYSRNPEDLKKVWKLSKKLEEIAPGSARGHSVLGLYYALKNDFDRSFLNLKRAWKVSANDAELSYIIGLFYYRAGLFRKAIRFCDRSITLDPFLPHSYVTPILCSIYLGDYSGAEIFIKKGAELRKDHPFFLELMCDLYLRTGKFNKAEQILEKLIAANYNPERIQNLQAILYALQGERDKALELNPTSSRVFAILGLKDRALAIMQKDGQANKDVNKYLYLINQPFYDNLRNDPRFQRIVAEAKEIYIELLRKYGDL